MEVMGTDGQLQPPACEDGLDTLPSRACDAQVLHSGASGHFQRLPSGAGTPGQQEDL